MITKNTKQFKDVYKIGKKPLGSGGFGVVYKCEHRVTKQVRAVKVVSKKKIKNMDKF
jgi:calcium-dependent protein kinase